MAGYYFSGRISEIGFDVSDVKIRMTPDTEYTVSRKETGADGKTNNISMAVFQPVDTKVGGIAFQYENCVVLTLQTKQCQGCACNVPFWVCGSNLLLELEENKGGGTCNVQDEGVSSDEASLGDGKMSVGQCVINCPFPKTFDIVKVTFK